MIDRLEESHAIAERNKYTADWQKLGLEFGLRPERCGPNAVLALQLASARIEAYKNFIETLLNRVETKPVVADADQNHKPYLAPSAVPAFLQQS